MKEILKFCKTSIGQKQVAAFTGLILTIIIIFYLLGMFLFFAGPKIFNAYRQYGDSVKPVLYLLKTISWGAFIIHIVASLLSLIQNSKARNIPYITHKSKGGRSLATRMMPCTGLLVFIFVMYYFTYFSFLIKEGGQGILFDGRNYGYYGIYFNYFSQPLHSSIYIMAMIALGFHLAHGMEIIVQTLGINPTRHPNKLNNFCMGFSIFIAMGFSSIPIFVWIKNLSF